MPSNHLILCRPLLLPPSIFPSVRSFSVSQFFVSGGQSIGASASASVLPMNSPSNYELLMLPFPPQPASPHSKGHLQPPIISGQNLGVMSDPLFFYLTHVHSSNKPCLLSSLSVFKIQPLHNTLAALSSFRVWSSLIWDVVGAPSWSLVFCSFPPLFSSQQLLKQVMFQLNSNHVSFLLLNCPACPILEKGHSLYSGLMRCCPPSSQAAALAFPLCSLSCFPVLGLARASLPASFLSFNFLPWVSWASQVVLVIKNPPASAGDIRDVGFLLHRWWECKLVQ